MRETLNKRDEAILRVINELKNGGGFIDWVYIMVRNNLYSDFVPVTHYKDLRTSILKKGQKAKEGSSHKTVQKTGKSIQYRKIVRPQIRSSIKILTDKGYLIKENSGAYASIHLPDTGKIFCSDDICPADVWKYDLIKKDLPVRKKRRRITEQVQKVNYA